MTCLVCGNEKTFGQYEWCPKCRHQNDYPKVPQNAPIWCEYGVADDLAQRIVSGRKRAEMRQEIAK